MQMTGELSCIQIASLLPLLAKNARAKLIEINLENTKLTPYVDQLPKGPAGEVLPKWWSELL